MCCKTNVSQFVKRHLIIQNSRTEIRHFLDPRQQNTRRRTNTYTSYTRTNSYARRFLGIDYITKSRAWSSNSQIVSMLGPMASFSIKCGTFQGQTRRGYVPLREKLYPVRFWPRRRSALSECSPVTFCMHECNFSVSRIQFYLLLLLFLSRPSDNQRYLFWSTVFL